MLSELKTDIVKHDENKDNHGFDYGGGLDMKEIEER